jgi:SAM-dependent methyltransferase
MHAPLAPGKMPGTMSLKEIVGSIIRAIPRVPVVRTLFYHPAVRARIQVWPGFRRFYGGGWDLRHPFDREYHTDTSGFVPSDRLLSSSHDSMKRSFYAGSQPSIIRLALNTLPALPECTFIDLGCGKGRPLLVASEYPFRSVIGVELSPSLILNARKNAATLSRQFSRRAPIMVEQYDAGQFPVPAGNAVIFLYNPFGQEVVASVVSRIEEALAIGGRTIFVIYYNPVHGHCFDGSRALTRYFAANLPYSREELGYGPDVADGVVIWQGGGTAPAHGNADAEIKITLPGVRAEIA